MCRLFLAFLIFIFLVSSLSASNKYNVSLENMSTCKEQTINDAEYVYSNFIDITTLANNPTVGKEELHLNLIVMAGMSANIMLSEQNNPNMNDWIYEFVLGGWDNKFSAYRLRLNGNWLWKKPSIDILSEFDPLPIEIIQNSDGLVSVNIPGKKMFLYYFDKKPLKIRYISFSASVKYSRWYYDCKFNGN